MNLHFDEPQFLLLALACLPLAAASWRWLSGMDRLRRAVVVGLRTLLLACLAVMLAGPRTVREHDYMTVIGVLDLSGSVKRFAELPADPELGRTSSVEYLRRWFRRATRTKAPDDRFGLVVFDGAATVISVPVKGQYVDDNLDVTTLEGTNIAEALRLALAMFPADTAKRIVLVTDGNETMGDALAAAREAAAGFLGERAGAAARRAAVPIDAALVDYRVAGDVQVVRVESPPTARPGQTVTVRVVLQATAPTPGLLELRREGEPIDLNGDAPGVSRRLELPAGRSVQLVQVVLGDTPVNRFEAVFEAERAEDDVLAVNNRAESFTATPGRGTVLVLDPRPDPSANALAAALTEAEIQAEARSPAALGEDLLALQRYDLIVLDNVAAHDLAPFQHTLLSRYVHDLGGGLIMVGGPRSFGAGGWNGSDLEAVLPVELDPPKQMKLADAALVLVLDKSGSMNEHVAGTRTTQQRIANEAAALAVESLRSESLVGVVTFDFGARVHVPLQRNNRPDAIAERIRAITSEGGTNLDPALRAARAMLRGVEAQRKLVVCLSDGRSHVTKLDALAQAMADDGIRITTIAVGDKADFETLRRIAEIGGGEFYPVRNPRTLPRVLVDSVQVINKPLLKEEPFEPQVRATGSVLTAGLESAPILDGLVITAPRPDPNVTVEAQHPDGEPLLAHWQVGLGRAAVFTSDADGYWSSRWIGWPGYGVFWAQLARAMSRPATSPDAELLTMIADGRLHITLEAAGEEGFVDYLRVDGTVYAPDGEAIPVTLRQTAPGRYEASLPATAPGNYVVALSPRRGNRRLAPVIGGASQSSSPEFRRLESNDALVAGIIDISGGKRLDLAEPADVFDRSELEPSRAALPAWQPLMWLALGLLLLDVASRRIAWDARLLRRSAARAAARVTPARLRGTDAAATLASLRQTGHAARRAAPRAHAAPPQPPPRTEPEAPAAPRSPDTASISAALGELTGKGGAAPPEADRPTPPAPAEPGEPKGSTETTSSLLAAKRRARKRLRGD